MDASRDFSDRLGQRESIWHDELSPGDRRTQPLLGIVSANDRRVLRKQVWIFSLEALPDIRARLRSPLGDQYHEKPAKGFVILRFDAEFPRQASQRCTESVDRFLQFALLQVRPGNKHVCLVIEEFGIDCSLLEYLDIDRHEPGSCRLG